MWKRISTGGIIPHPHPCRKVFPSLPKVKARKGAAPAPEGLSLSQELLSVSYLLGTQACEHFSAVSGLWLPRKSVAKLFASLGPSEPALTLTAHLCSQTRLQQPIHTLSCCLTSLRPSSRCSHLLLESALLAAPFRAAWCN